MKDVTGFGYGLRLSAFCASCHEAFSVAVADMTALRSLAATSSEEPVFCSTCRPGAAPALLVPKPLDATWASIAPIDEALDLPDAALDSAPADEPVFVEPIVVEPPAGPIATFLRSSHMATVVGVLAGSAGACWYAGHFLLPGPLVVVGALLGTLALALVVASAHLALKPKLSSRRRYATKPIRVPAAPATLSQRVQEMRAAAQMGTPTPPRVLVDARGAPLSDVATLRPTPAPT